GSVFQSRISGVTDTASAGPQAKPSVTAPAPAEVEVPVTGIPAPPGSYQTPTPLPPGTNWSAFGPRQAAVGLGVLTGDQAGVVTALGGKIYTGRPGGIDGSQGFLQPQESNGLNVTRVDAIVQP